MTIIKTRKQMLFLACKANNDLLLASLLLAQMKVKESHAPWTTTWLLGTSICWPSLVCAYWSMVAPGWAAAALVMVRVGRPCTPSVPLLASWMAPPCVIATVSLMGWVVSRQGQPIRAFHEPKEGKKAFDWWESKWQAPHTRWTYCIVRCWSGKWVWGRWRWWSQGPQQQPPMNPPRPSPPRCEGQRGHPMKGHSESFWWWNHNTSQPWDQPGLYPATKRAGVGQVGPFTCMRGAGTEFLYAFGSRSHYPPTPVNLHFLLLWRSGKTSPINYPEQAKHLGSRSPSPPPRPPKATSVEWAGPSPAVDLR